MRPMVTSRAFEILGLALPLLASAGCGPAGAEPPPPYQEGLAMTIREGSTDGTFGQDGQMVAFSGRSDADQRATLELEIAGRPLEIVLDLATQTMSEDAHGNVFELANRWLVLGLRDAVAEQHPEVLETLHGRLFVKAADRYAEVPIGPSLQRHEVKIGVVQQAVTVQSGCGNN